MPNWYRCRTKTKQSPICSWNCLKSKGFLLDADDMWYSRAAAAPQPRRIVPDSNRSPRRKQSKPEGEDKSKRAEDLQQSQKLIYRFTHFSSKTVRIQLLKHKDRMPCHSSDLKMPLEEIETKYFFTSYRKQVTNWVKTMALNSSHRRIKWCNEKQSCTPDKEQNHSEQIAFL